MLSRTGFKNVIVKDGNELFLQTLQDELRHFQHTEDAFVQEFSQNDYNTIVDDWKNKVIFINTKRFLGQSSIIMIRFK